ncbi:unnamed protein product [Prorocentrum cordatum]|uniref:Pyridoxal 5'-phosphate synthase n=1 Tax=Prorocentrum cordatum TaxID=2364126 RepID=A0ABN9VZA4_9DINO|nr:unnamed protein product [Polarella glacialis]
MQRDPPTPFARYPRGSRPVATGAIAARGGAGEPEVVRGGGRCAGEPSVYPSWLFGEWEVRSRPVAFGEPLGARFVDAETRRAIRGDVEAGAEVAWRSRFYWAGAPAAAPGPVVQFRAFNAAQEVRAFLGRGGRQVIGEGDPRERPVRVLVAYPVEEGEAAWSWCAPCACASTPRGASARGRTRSCPPSCSGR